MPIWFFSAIRLAGLNVGLLLVMLFFVVLLVIVAWRVLRAILMAILVLVLLPFALYMRASGLPREPQTEGERIAREKLRETIEPVILSALGALQISGGGTNRRRIRMLR